MISDEVVRGGLAAVSVAAVVLLEDAADGLTAAVGVYEGGRIAATLKELGADLSALAAAADVLARHRDDGSSGPPAA